MNLKSTALASLVFVFLYNILFFKTGWGVGIGLLFLSLNIYFFFVKLPGNKNLNLALISSGISIFFANLFSLRSNGIVQFIDLGIAVFFSFVALYLCKYKGEISFQIPKLFLFPVLAIESSIVGVFKLFNQSNWSRSENNQDTTVSLIRGFVIAIPILVVLFFLLIQSDPIFGKLAQNFLSNIGERAIVSLIVFIILMGFGLALIIEKIVEPKSLHINVGKHQELSVILGSIIILFAVFIGVQFRYLFSSTNEGDLHQLGIASLTYSEYVRKGFFELLIASTIASFVIIYTFKYLHSLTLTQKLIVQFFSGILTVETGLLLLSDAKRLSLYATEHGLTRARIFGFIFLIWLSVLLIIFLIRVFKEMKKEWFFGVTVTSVLLAFLTINLVNIDGLIATKYKPTVNKEIDYFYLANLSPDATSSWKEAVKDSERIITELESVETLSTEDNRRLYWTRNTLSQINFKVGNLIDKYGTLNQIRNWHINDQGTYMQELRFAKSTDEYPEFLRNQRKWQSLNFAELSAYREIEDNIEIFQQIYPLLQRISTLDFKVSDEVRKNTPLDRLTDPPLLN